MNPSLLNALLDYHEEQRIVSVEILNPELPKEHWKDKTAILDVRAKDGRDQLYNIEVQLSSQRAYAERVIYYASRLFCSQLTPGEHYGKLKKTISISLLDFTMFADVEDLHTKFRFYDKAKQLELSDALELHFIELSKFKSDKPHHLRTLFEKWLHVLKFSEFYNDERVEIPTTLAREEGIVMAIESMREASASQQVREIMEARLKAGWDEANRLEEAREKGFEKGHQEGLEEGRQEGPATGA